LQVLDDFVDGFLIRLIDAGSALPTFHQQTSFPEGSQVLGHRRSRRVEVLGNVTGGQPTKGDELDDPATGGIRQCSKC
jgi:hypothetical protein